MSENETKLQFDYSVWTPNTKVLLCQVPWDNSYRDVVMFSTIQERDEYFSSLSKNNKAISIDNMVYLRYGEPIRISVPFSAVNRCNYIIAKNPIQPVPSIGGVRSPDTFYYFINDIRYIAPNTTELDIQLDVWTTYIDRVTFGQCYIERSHIGIANENSTINNLNNYLIEPEGFEIGLDYYGANVKNFSFISDTPYAVITSTADLTTDFGNINNPNLDSSKGSVNDGIPSGSISYIIEGSDFVQFMTIMSGYPWISQCIQSITIIPSNFVSKGKELNFQGTLKIWELQSTPDGLEQIVIDNASSLFQIPSRYKNLLKFYTRPYTTIECTNYQGSTLNFSLNEVYTPNKIRFDVESVICPPFCKVMVYPQRLHDENAVNVKQDYKTMGEGREFEGTAYIESGDQIEAAIVYDNFPQCSIVNNQYLNILASTVHSRSYQEQAASWSQQKALNAANLSYAQSSKAIDASLNSTDISNNAAWGMNEIANQKALWGGIGGAIGGAGSAASGNIGGGLVQAGQSIANTGLNMIWNDASTAISTSTALMQAMNNAELNRYNRDTNYEYAQYAANGDYAVAIQSIQAKVDDARLTPPTVSGTVGGDAFNFSNGYYGLIVKFKQPAMHFIRQIGDFWLRYGYAINRFMVPPKNLTCMTKVTYWKMQNSMIFADIPEMHKNAIRGILEKGVSVWRKPQEINNIDLGDNEPLEGIKY